MLFFGRCYVAASIPHFVSLEVRTIDTLCRFGFLACLRQRARIAVLWMEAVIYAALEVAGAMKPRADANEAVPVKPFRTIVASGSATIRSDVIVPLWTIRRYPDFDADLSLCFGNGSGDADSRNSSQH